MLKCKFKWSLDRMRKKDPYSFVLINSASLIHCLCCINPQPDSWFDCFNGIGHFGNYTLGNWMPNWGIRDGEELSQNLLKLKYKK